MLLCTRVAERLRLVVQLAKERMAFEVCKTWLRQSEDSLKAALDVSVEAPALSQLTKGYGEAALILNQLVPFETTHTVSTPSLQSITVRTKNMSITTTYASPRAKSEELLMTLSDIDKVSKEKGVIMRDLNARNKQLDVRENARGRALNPGRHARVGASTYPRRLPSDPQPARATRICS